MNGYDHLKLLAIIYKKIWLHLFTQKYSYIYLHKNMVTFSLGDFFRPKSPPSASLRCSRINIEIDTFAKY